MEHDSEHGGTARAGADQLADSPAADGDGGVRQSGAVRGDSAGFARADGRGAGQRMAGMAGAGGGGVRLPGGRVDGGRPVRAAGRPVDGGTAEPALGAQTAAKGGAARGSDLPGGDAGRERAAADPAPGRDDLWVDRLPGRGAGGGNAGSLPAGGAEPAGAAQVPSAGRTAVCCAAGRAGGERPAGDS